MNQPTLAAKVYPRLFTLLLAALPGVVCGGVETTSPPAPEKASETPVRERTWCETPKPFELRVSVPGWLAGVSGESGVNGLVSSSDVTFSQLLRHLTHVPIVLALDARYQRWEFFGDGQYLTLGTSASLPGILFTTANLHLTSGLAEVFLGYRLIDCDKATLSIFAGARYTYSGADISIFNNGDARLPLLRQLLGISNKLEDDGSTSWVDPVVGARGKVKVWKAVSIYAQGDIGGFDANSGAAFEVHRQGPTLVKTPVASSDWSYQVQGGLEVQLTRSVWTKLGWRYLKYDYRNGGYTNKTELNGPYLETGINF